MVILPSQMSVQGNNLVATKPTEGAAEQIQVGTIFDTNVHADTPTATVTWLDTGATETASVQKIIDGKWGVYASHAFQHAGKQLFTVKGTRGDHLGFGVGSVTVKPAGIVGYAGDFNVTGDLTSGWGFASQVVGGFTSYNPYARATDFTATVHWADGTASSGTVVLNEAGTGYDVLGSHTYDKIYSYLGEGFRSAPVWVAVKEMGQTIGYTGGNVYMFDDDVNDLPEENYVTPPVDAVPPPLPNDDEETGTEPGGEDGEPTITNATDGDLSADGVRATAVEGQSLEGAVLATFTDSTDDPQLDINSYSATATYDGQTFDCEIVGGDGSYSVLAPPGVYAGEEGKQSVSVTIQADATDEHDARSVSVNSALTVNDAPLTALDVQRIRLPANHTLTDAVIGRFSDAFAAAPLSDFTGTIDWGDGSTSAATIRKAQGEDGVFEIIGSHTYDPSTTHDEDGTEVLNDNGDIIGYAISTDVRDEGGSRTTCGAEVDLIDQPKLAVTLGDGDDGMILQGSADGTQNLVPLYLDVPGALPSGTHVTLTGEHADQYYVWLTPNPGPDDQPVLGGDGADSVEWTADGVPQQLYVGALKGSAAVGDIVFHLSDDATEGTCGPTTATSNPATAIRVKLRMAGSNDDDLNGKQPTGPVWVGQHVSLSVVVDGPAALSATYQWTLRGDTFGNYAADVNSGRKAEIDEGSGFYQDNIDYHYADSGKEDATCVVSVNGVAFPVTTTLDVQKPDSTIDATLAWIARFQRPGGKIAWGLGSATRAGNVLANGVGMELKASVAPVAAGGTWAIIQTVNIIDQYQQNQDALGGALVKNRNGGAGWLCDIDPTTNSFLYSPATALGGQPPAPIVDSPGLFTDNQQWIQSDEQFRDFLMYKPAGQDSSWVPLRELDWAWGGEAYRFIVAATGKESWATVNGYPSSVAGKTTPVASQLSSAFPEWTKNAADPNPWVPA